MMSFKNGQESVQKAKVLNYERTGEGTKADKIIITYIRTDNTDNKELQASKLTSTFTAEEKALLQEAKKNQSEVTLTKVFSQPEGAEKGYWNLSTIKAASEFVAKPPSKFNGNKFSGPSTQGNSKPAFDSSGAKAGGVLHDAVAVAVAKYGKEVTSEHVATLAQELLAISTALETQIRNETNGVTSTASPKKTETVAAIAAKKQVVEEPSFDTLDDLDSIEIDL